MGSSNDNSQTGNKGIIGKASEMIHNTMQTDKDRKVIEEGKKSTVDKAYDTLSTTLSGKKETETTKNGGGGGILEGARQAIYNATKPAEEKKLELNAQKDALDMGKDDVAAVASKLDDAVHAAVLPLEGKDYEDWKNRKEKGLLEG